MGNLIGKLNNDEYCNIVALDSGSIYSEDESLQLIPYDYRYTLEDGEWFVIKEFSEQTYGNIDYLENTTNFDCNTPKKPHHSKVENSIIKTRSFHNEKIKIHRHTNRQYS